MSTVTGTTAFPDGFQDLERFSGWCLPTEAARNALRLSSDYADIKDLYDTVLPRLDAIFELVNGYPLDEMPADVLQLTRVALALAELAPAVEWYRQPAVVDGFDPARFVIHQ